MGAIRMKQPSLVVHSHDVPGHKYQMKWTWKMQPNATARDLANWVLHANHGQFGAQGQRLENIIINCHGDAGQLYIGGTRAAAFRIADVGNFGVLQGHDIGTIWLVACEVARGRGTAAGQDGMAFCAALAQAAGCDVVAGGEDQHVEFGFYLRGCPWGCIDEFEGVAYRFKPTGGYVWYSFG
jgi:hypothetical protein